MSSANLSPVLEFHISRRARERYRFDLALFSTSGNVIIANLRAARLFAQRLNESRAQEDQAGPITASQINSLGLIDELLHNVLRAFRERQDPAVMRRALETLERNLGRAAVDRTLYAFAEQFPPLAVYRGEATLEGYLAGTSGERSHRELALEELLMLWLENENPIFAPLSELIDDKQLAAETDYPRIIAGLREFFRAQPPVEGARDLFDLLRAPALVAPYSAADQLAFLQQLLPPLRLETFTLRLLGGLDMLREETRPSFAGPGPARVPFYGPVGRAGTGLEMGAGPADDAAAAGAAGMPGPISPLVAGPWEVAPELGVEKYSPDLHWMPRLVLLAKSTYVWLDQLSTQYESAITRLDQIPDEELDLLARRGITGLWFIGLWERSPASRRIKHASGNVEAAASAYSLFDYKIAAELGGPEAYARLRERAEARGIRLASDMVPNHMGLDSKWVLEHSEWFISSETSPYPNYTFTGPDLSSDPRVSLLLEDHYYDYSDAAVVFKRIDRETGRELYIYHGNDGTAFPWNDTAQLNYLIPDLREAVIQAILQVARQFPIIRFDAAMTLAKRHYQRLWFPESGSGGAIPSRSEYALTKEQFDALMPVEFWREVVDRVAVEAPETLLLAEAFWLMESYFVRTLGMHRVYNSAFMGMLREEENAKYRLLMKNTLEFDPEILKRYVNFMNNPDERTAIDQFGRDDKYFGVCTLMATMPGLPMFGHGQIEGLTERYGMEYRRARLKETVNSGLVDRHAREIFPLLHRRKLFAEVEHFLLYDFFTPAGHVSEDVFAYSNRYEGERALVVYYNTNGNVRGWIRTSAAFRVGSGADGEGHLEQRTLGQGLGVTSTPGNFTIFRDQASGLEFIRSSRELNDNGLYMELGAYESHVFLDFREVQDNAWRQYAHLAGSLQGRGVPSIQAALLEISLQTVQEPLRELVDPALLRQLIQARARAKAREKLAAARAEHVQGMGIAHLIAEVGAKETLFAAAAAQFAGAAQVPGASEEVRRTVEAILALPALEDQHNWKGTRKYAAALEQVRRTIGEDPARWGELIIWGLLQRVGQVGTPAIGGEEKQPEAATPPEEPGAARSERESNHNGTRNGREGMLNGGRQATLDLLNEWQLGKIVSESLRALGITEAAAWQAVPLLALLVDHKDWFIVRERRKRQAAVVLEAWLADNLLAQFLQVNRYNAIEWFNQEAFEQWLDWALVTAVVRITARPDAAARTVANEIEAAYEVIETLRRAEASSEFQVERLRKSLKQGRVPALKGPNTAEKEQSAAPKEASKEERKPRKAKSSAARRRKL